MQKNGIYLILMMLTVMLFSVTNANAIATQIYDQNSPNYDTDLGYMYEITCVNTATCDKIIAYSYMNSAQNTKHMLYSSDSGSTWTNYNVSAVIGNGFWGNGYNQIVDENGNFIILDRVGTSTETHFFLFNTTSNELSYFGNASNGMSGLQYDYIVGKQGTTGTWYVFDVNAGSVPYVTTDNGQSFTTLTQTGYTTSGHNRVECNENDCSIMFACADTDSQISTDSGATWNNISVTGTGCYDVDVSPSGQYIIFGDGGTNTAYFSADYGSTWNSYVSTLSDVNVVGINDIGQMFYFSTDYANSEFGYSNDFGSSFTTESFTDYEAMFGSGTLSDTGVAYFGGGNYTGLAGYEITVLSATIPQQSPYVNVTSCPVEMQSGKIYEVQNDIETDYSVCFYAIGSGGLFENIEINGNGYTITNNVSGDNSFAVNTQSNAFNNITVHDINFNEWRAGIFTNANIYDITNFNIYNIRTENVTILFNGGGADVRIDENVTIRNVYGKNINDYSGYSGYITVSNFDNVLIDNVTQENFAYETTFANIFARYGNNVQISNYNYINSSVGFFSSSGNNYLLENITLINSFPKITMNTRGTINFVINNLLVNGFQKPSVDSTNEQGINLNNATNVVLSNVEFVNYSGINNIITLTNSNNVLFNNFRNAQDYFDNAYSRFTMTSSTINDTSSNNTGWFPQLTNLNNDVTSQLHTQYYNYSNGYNYDLTLNTSLHTYYNNNGYVAPPCVEDWVANDTTCNGVNYTIQYYDSNSCGTFDNLPIDNGTVVSCTLPATGLNKYQQEANTYANNYVVPALITLFVVVFLISIGGLLIFKNNPEFGKTIAIIVGAVVLLLVIGFVIILSTI